MEIALRKLQATAFALPQRLVIRNQLTVKFMIVLPGSVQNGSHVHLARYFVSSNKNAMKSRFVVSLMTIVVSVLTFYQVLDGAIQPILVTTSQPIVLIMIARRTYAAKLHSALPIKNTAVL